MVPFFFPPFSKGICFICWLTDSGLTDSGVFGLADCSHDIALSCLSYQMLLMPQVLASQMPNVLSWSGKAETRKEHRVAKSREKAMGSFNYLVVPGGPKCPTY